MLSDTIAEKQVIVNSEGLNTGYYRCEAFITEIQDKAGKHIHEHSDTNTLAKRA